MVRCTFACTLDNGLGAPTLGYKRATCSVRVLFLLVYLLCMLLLRAAVAAIYSTTCLAYSFLYSSNNGPVQSSFYMLVCTLVDCEWLYRVLKE